MEIMKIIFIEGVNQLKSITKKIVDNQGELIEYDENKKQPCSISIMDLLTKLIEHGDNKSILLILSHVKPFFTYSPDFIPDDQLLSDFKAFVLLLNDVDRVIYNNEACSFSDWVPYESLCEHMFDKYNQNAVDKPIQFYLRLDQNNKRRFILWLSRFDREKDVIKN